jgi:general L-amino acid transport system substrate-binding protein
MRRMRRAGLAAAGAVALAHLTAAAPAGAQGSATLDAVRARGALRCGVSTGFPGFAAPDSRGEWRGLDVDACRAVAAAALGDAAKVQHVPLTAVQRLPALTRKVPSQITTAPASRS